MNNMKIVNSFTQGQFHSLKGLFDVWKLLMVWLII